MPINAYQQATNAHDTLHRTAESNYYAPYYTNSGRTSIHRLLEDYYTTTEENIKKKSVYYFIPTLYQYRYKNTPIPTYSAQLSSENALANPFEKNAVWNCITNAYTTTSTVKNNINFIKINKGINNVRGLLLDPTPTNGQCSEVIKLLKSNHPNIIGIDIGRHPSAETITINVFVKEQTADIIIDTIHAYPLIIALTHPETPETERYVAIAQEIATLSTLAPKEYCEYLTQAFNTITQQILNTQAEGLIEKLASDIAQQKTKNVQSEINSCEHDITFYESKLQEFYKKLNKAHLQKLGILETTKNLKTDLETITKRYAKHITLLKLNSNKILKAQVNTTLRIYDEEQAKRVINNMVNCDRRTILEKLFVSGKYTLLVQQVFKIDFTRENIEAESVFNTAAAALITNGGLPGNPHLMFHHCFGQNRSQINKAIASLDFERLYTALIACASSMNLYDGVVVNSLGNFLVNCLNDEGTNNLPIIYDEENQMNISLKQLMEIANNETNNPIQS